MTEPDDLIRDEADLFQALECADWHDVKSGSTRKSNHSK